MTGITKDCHQGLMAESDREIAVEEGELWVELKSLMLNGAL